MSEVQLEEILCIDDNVVRIVGIENKYDFPSSEHAKRFAEIYRQLATEPIKDLEKNMENYVIGRKLDEREKRHMALFYFKGGGTYCGDSRSMQKVLDRTWELYKKVKI